MKRAGAVGPLLGLALALAAASAGDARSAELDRGDLRLELRPQVRSLFTFTRELDPDRLFVYESTKRRDSGLWLVRARLDGQAAYQDRLYAQVVYDNEVRTGSGLDGLAFAVGDAAGTDTWLDADRVISHHDDADWRDVLYRAFVRYEGQRVEVTLGRQRIPLGRGRLWNPIDLFNPIYPLAIEGDQRIGQDALRVRAELRPEVHGELIWSPKDDPDEQRGALRLELTRRAFDVAAMVGRIERDWVFGADFAANLGDAALRGEATFSDLARGGRIWQVVASIDRTFELGNGLYVLAEHLYNENLLDPEELMAALQAPPPISSVETGVDRLAALQREARNRITTAVRNQTGVQLGYEISPVWRADLLVIYDWHGPSASFVPAVTHSLRTNVEVALGAQLFAGPDRGSEYGDRPCLAFLQVDLFF